MDLFFGLDSHEQVKVIAHQAVGEGIGDWLDVVSVELEKVGIVALFDKDVFAIVAAIVNVIVFAVLKRNRLWHGVFVRRPDRRFARPVRSRLSFL